MKESTLQKYDFGENCVCVGRVSTSQQSQTAQVADLKQFAKELGYKKVKVFFTTESGFLEVDDKEGWNLVTDFFETHPDYRVLICPEMSRLSRKEGILFKIKDYLKEHKIQLIIKDIRFSLYDEWGQIPKGNDIVFALYASLADSEMRQKKERTRRVLEDYRMQGFSIGGKELFGYNRCYKEKDGKQRSYYEINEEEAKQIKTIYKWYAFGIDGDLTKASVVEITKRCIEEGFSHYLHSRRNVNKCLKEQAYTGQKETHNRVQNSEFWNYRQHDKPKYIKGVSYICTYPPIFKGDEIALFNKVQERLRENNSKFVDGIPIDKSTKHITILSKLMKCPNCGTYLGGEYRIRKDKRYPNKKLEERVYNTYRCHYSRGTVSNCSFKHVLSMPLLDSVVWAYCKEAVIYLLDTEQRKSVQEQIAELDKKIANIDERIKGFNIEGKIRAEETIFRSKVSVLKTPEATQDAEKEFQQRLKQLDKELKDYEKRKLELEQEKEDIKNREQFIDSFARQKNIATNKKQIYQYIHRLVDSVELVHCDRYYNILKVHLKQPNWLCRNDEYICMKKRTTLNVTSLIVQPVDLDKVRHALKPEQTVIDWRRIIRSLPANDTLHWNETLKQFEIDGAHFTVEELFTFDKTCPSIVGESSSHERIASSTQPVLPLYIRELEVERLTCYDEDRTK